ARGVAHRHLDPGDGPGRASLLPTRPAPPPGVDWRWPAERDDRAADVGRVKVGLDDVLEVDREHLADLERPDSSPGALEARDLEHEHVAAVAAEPVEPAPGRGPVLGRRDDLEEGVAEREDGVSQSEARDARVGERL